MTAIAGEPRKLTIDEFLAFYDTRPDEEQWQLIDGVALLMTPPFPTHQRIASNLQRLLEDAFERDGLPYQALQRVGIQLEDFPHYRPEPDVAVLDLQLVPGQRHLERFYLAAEILSESDEDRTDLKRSYYRSHEHNRTVLLVSQDRMEAEFDRRTGDGWITSTLNEPDARLELPDMGLSCRLADLYRNTPLARG